MTRTKQMHAGVKCGRDAQASQPGASAERFNRGAYAGGAAGRQPGVLQAYDITVTKILLNSFQINKNT